MISISIVAYAISIQNKNDEQSYSLNNIDGNCFLDIFNDFVVQNQARYENNERLERVFKFQECIFDEIQDGDNVLFNYITGQIKTGAYGQESEIINSETGGLTYNKTETDAEVMPFNFIIAIPEGEVNRGILILQKNGVYGIKALFEEVINQHLRNINNDYKCILGNVAPIAYLERLLEEGILQKVRFFRYEIPNDVGNQIGLNNGVENSYEEYVINKPTGFIRTYRNRIQECIRGQRVLTNIVELRNFDYDNIKLEFKLGKKYKTINLSDVTSISFNEDISDFVDLIGGHPTTESIRPILIDTAETYLGEMGLIVRG
jgi:hypothetical protein